MRPSKFKLNEKQKRLEFLLNFFLINKIYLCNIGHYLTKICSAMLRTLTVFYYEDQSNLFRRSRTADLNLLQMGQVSNSRWQGVPHQCSIHCSAQTYFSDPRHTTFPIKKHIENQRIQFYRKSTQKVRLAPTSIRVHAYSYNIYTEKRIPRSSVIKSRWKESGLYMFLGERDNGCVQV